MDNATLGGSKDKQWATCSWETEGCSELVAGFCFKSTSMWGDRPRSSILHFAIQRRPKNMNIDPGIHRITMQVKEKKNYSC